MLLTIFLINIIISFREKGKPIVVQIPFNVLGIDIKYIQKWDWSNNKLAEHKKNFKVDSKWSKPKKIL